MNGTAKCSLLPKRCIECRYHGYLSSDKRQIFCAYILIERKMRGCPADRNCDKFVKGERISIEKRHFY